MNAPEKIVAAKVAGTLDRAAALSSLSEGRRFDVVIIGGGATGLGIAVDAAARGFQVALLERHDFGKGTSSRATKLLHGGVRYLAQGNISLVREALHERTQVLRNAPHLAQPLAFLTPTYGIKGALIDRPFYGIGLKLYDLLAGAAGLGDTEFLSAARTLALMPGVRADHLSGSIRYWDGQFDDARLAVALARTAVAHGAALLNHCPVIALAHDGERVSGVQARDEISGQTLNIQAGCVINACGVWVDAVRRMDQAAPGDMVAPSQGVHLVVDAEFLHSDHALLVPKTRDGRVLFAVPWLGKLILGTTDSPRNDLAEEPRPFDEEVAFILEEAARYLARAPGPADIRSVWVGLRPLVKPPSNDGANTKALSREHTVVVDSSGLTTVTGGKWTTYRAMAEDVLEACAEQGLIDRRGLGATRDLRLIGAPDDSGQPISAAPGPHLYGSDAAAMLAMPGARNWLTPELSEAMVRFAVRVEGARTLEDVLARRSRLLFLDARAAIAVAPVVAGLIAQELGQGYDASADLAAFLGLADGYCWPS
ncbi:MAG: glycerol-3-phosphate dehydrogenase/oxidase [Burkholderiaceae bacterium]